jgi:putative cardiolipin synthase
MAQNFIDVDAFAIGFIVAPLQALFDRYWNSDPVYPLQSVAHTTMSKEELLTKFDEWTGPAHTPPPAPLPANDILGYGPIAEDLEAGQIGLIWGDAYVFADYPDKPFEPGDGGELLETSATYNAFEAMRAAKSEIVGTSPYLVPGQRGMALLKELRDRGVKVTLMTNSLGSTDEQLVHLGYRRYREDMLKIGVDLYELSAARVKKNPRMFLYSSSLGRLHAKLLVIDRKKVFVGSMNLDPRSAITNTELGAVIESPELARELLRVIDIDRLQSAYRVRLAPQGGLEWVSLEGDEEVVRVEEPESSGWTQIKLWLLDHLVPESLL